MPRFAHIVWVAFNSMSRPPSMSGIARISQQEIAAYQFNHDIKFNSFEIEMIELIDSVAVEVFSKIKG